VNIAIAGGLAQRPGRGGHAWVFLQYLLGFRELGHEVLFIDSLDKALSLDKNGEPCAVDSSAGWGYVESVMREHGLDGSYALLHDGGCLGLSRSELARRLRASDVLLNFNGYLRDEQLLLLPDMRVFVDIDPGFGQIWAEQGLYDGVADHHRYATVGLRIGLESTIPTRNKSWVPTLPPVVMSCWQPSAEFRPYFTSVVTWRGPFAPLQFGGLRLGLRVHSLRGFANLPRLCAVGLELALDIDSADDADADLLRNSGWHLVDPLVVASTPREYQRYVATSMGELMVAKEIYVKTKSGWFSDRSACYLASGRPVVAQDTGWSLHLPHDRGLVAFSDPEEAAAALTGVNEDIEDHSRAARDIAGDCFSSTVVLPRLLASIGLA
jgi:hypothetical protein